MPATSPSVSPSVSPDLLLMLLADARLPVAGHTQSGQLEAAVRDGLGAGQVPAFLRSRLATVVRVEAGTAVATRAALSAGSPRRLEELLAAWAARTPAAAMRETSRTLARALLRLVRRLWPGSEAIAAVAALPGVCRPMVLGAVAAETGLAPDALVRLVAYDDLQTVASAALKLLPLDPATTTAWVHEALAEADLLAVELASVATPEQVPATSAPLLDLWAAAHARTTRRLFSA